MTVNILLPVRLLPMLRGENCLLTKEEDFHFYLLRRFYFCLENILKLCGSWKLGIDRISARLSHCPSRMRSDSVTIALGLLKPALDKTLKESFFPLALMRSATAPILALTRRSTECSERDKALHLSNI